MPVLLAAAALIFSAAGSAVYAGAVSPEASESGGDTEIIAGEVFLAETPAFSAAALLPEDNEELLEGYITGELTERGALSAERTYGLTGRNLAIFRALRERVADVAAGRLYTTEFTLSTAEMQLDGVEYSAADLGIEAIYTDDGFSEEAVPALMTKLGIDMDRIISALIADAPCDLYWFDKLVPVDTEGIGAVVVYDPGLGEYVFGFESGDTFRFAVAEEFAQSAYEVDPAVTEAVSGTIANIGTILDDYEGAADYEKLCGYRDEICSRVTYNDEAAQNPDTPYGNPWQLLWVFDGDPGTNVVCEGYAKAFQYLCDMTDFASSRISSRITGGTMYVDGEAGDHMWNVVTMENGKNYLVDLTNSDEGSIGDAGELFLAGTPDGSLDGGWCFICYDTEVVYLYDGDTRAIYADGELILAAEPYVWDGIERPDFGTPDAFLPEDLTEIGEEAFAGDTSLTSVRLPDGVERIGARAFAGCSGLRRICIPESVQDIADDAFSGCTDLLIYGWPGSRAEEWAGEKGIPFAEMTE